MDTQTVLISLTASIFTVLGGKFWDTYWNKRVNDEELHYLCIRLIYFFENYASVCIKRITNHEHFEFSNNMIGEPVSGFPSLPNFPESNAYKKLEHPILWKIFNFPQKIMDYEGHIDYSRSLKPNEEKELYLRFNIHLGLQALDISEQLRTQYQLDLENTTTKPEDLDEFYSKYQQLINFRARHEQL